MSRPRRTTAVLSDGRELFYYDPADAEPRQPHADQRGLERATVRTMLRRDPLLDEDVVLASHRQTRTFLPPAELCPLCPSRPGRLTEIPDPDYAVAVFENRFPSFANPGRCEVVCFTADHDASFSSLPADRVRLVVDAWADRVAELSERPDVAEVFVFENRGEAIGVTLHHPHGQVYAFPFVTPRTQRMLDVARAHRSRTGRDLHGDVLAAERAGPRVVVDGERWTGYVPEGARWPIEVHLVPHRHVPDLAALDDDERDELARIYPDLLGRLDRFHGDAAPVHMPYIAAWHAAPVREGRDLLRLHLQLFSIQRGPDRLKFLAGSESAKGAFINDLIPEDTAQRLRDA